MKRDISKIEETKALAYKIAKHSKPGDIYFLRGDLGTGKTAFTKFFAQALGADAKSPSFGIVNLYPGITHMDLYRLETYEEALNIGIEDILEDDTIKIIEWPEILEGEEPDLLLVFSYEGEGRSVTLSGPFLERGAL
ncbi:MAG: tRNA (adenosine(37)-N6)-threonylcarbamoyltransferase complex ATPase subunit type 1 TsaE [Tissierellia bacterium]|nr:tRNA (adenosine(37)-N6)-threonylcarbamoyltransferase complex ATPase subunit type 1 TsaE [Tissierellia bacterium]